jgi:hypothetical protein
VYGTNTLSLATGGTAAVTVDSSQNVGIGTSSPAEKLEVAGILRLSTNPANPSTNDASFYNASGIGPTISGNAISFRTQLAERARIDTSGNLLVGTTSTSQTSGVGAKVFSTGNVWIVSPSGDGFSYYNSTASAYRFYVGSGGTISATSGTISVISDQRLKENVRDLNDGLDKVMALQPRLYDWKEGKGQDIKNARGFIAQEFEQVFPDMIDEWKDPAPEGEEPYKSVRADLIPVLVKAIQEQQALITQLQSDVAALKAAA